MGNWGIAKTATSKEKLKSEMADFLGGLNSVGEIDYSAYSEIFDFSMDLLDKMYDLDKSELSKELEKYRELEKQGRLIEFPCKVGDYVEFSDGSIRPVVSLTKSNNGDINIGCQNGHIVSMKLQYSGWVKRFIPQEEYETK